MQDRGAAPTEAAVPAAAAPQYGDVLARLAQGASGKRLPDGSLAVRRAEPAGCALYGPYWQLPAGWYRLRFECRVGEARFAAQPFLGVEIIVLNRVQRAWRDFTAAELADGAGEVLFEVTDEVSREARNEGRFEFRFFHLGTADFRVTAARLTRLAPDAAPAGDERRWRLLGRLQKALIGTRRPDGTVSVGRRSLPGVLLYGGWPYLRLARGRYRLRVAARCDAAANGAAASGAVASGAAPVLAVEIVGHSRWRDRGLLRAALRAGEPRAGTLVRCELTAADLAAGGAVEFAVPTELSIDSGIDAPFEFRLLHFANAELSIAAIDLHRLGGEPARDGVTPPAPAVHPAGRKKIVLIGNCQSEVVRQGFSRVESLSGQFDASYHFVTLPSNLHEFARRDLEAADIVLVQDIRDWENFPLRDCIRPGVDTIKFPGVRFASLWPFDAWNGPGDSEAHEREAPNLTFAYLDGLLARLRREVPDPEARYRAYRDLECAGVVNYRRLHDFEERRLGAMDRKFGVAIGAFILDQFRRRRILHTTVRPNRQVLDLLMQFILRAIGVRGRHPLPEHIENLLSNPQVPVHPMVARELGVRWADERTLYLHGGRQVTWETYIRSYIAHYG